VRYIAILIVGSVLLALPACSAAERTATPVSASAVGLASPGSTGAVTSGAPEPAASPRVTAKAASVTITAVGDTMLGNTPDLPPDPATYFEPVESILDPGAQIVFGNLEGTLTTSTTSKCGVQKGPDTSCFAFRDPPGYAQYFKAAGFQ
jgi:hypothetical protein